MVQTGVSKTDGGKRPLGSRRGVLRAQELNERLRQQRAAQSAAETAAAQKRVDSFSRTVPRTAFERKLFQQQRQRAAQAQREQRAAQAQREHPVARATAKVPAAAAPRPQRRQPETLARPTMTPEIKQRPLGQPRYHEGLAVDTPVGELAGLADYEPRDSGAAESPAAAQSAATQLDAAQSEQASAPAPEAEPAPAPKEAPQSPFLKSVQVEKRPLSHRVAPGEAVPSEVFADFDEHDAELTPPPPAAEPRKRSVWPLVGLILLTVLLGGAVGAAVYLLIFQEF